MTTSPFHPQHADDPAAAATAAAAFAQYVPRVDLDPPIREAPEEEPETFEQAVARAKWRRRVDRTAAREILAEDGGFGLFDPAKVIPSIDFIASDDPAPLIEGVIGRGELVMLFSPPYAGKSFASMGMAHAIAAGGEWAGRKAARGRVLYVLLEGDATWRARSRAWHQHAGVAPVPGVDVFAQSVSFLDPATVHAVAEHVRGRGYDLVIVDTLSRSIAGAPEEATEEMSAYVGALTQLREATGDGSVVALHHAKKDNPLQYRGSTTLGAGMDRILCLTMKDAKEPHRVLVTQKSKASQLPDDMALEFVQVAGSAVLVDSDGGTLERGIRNLALTGRTVTRAALLDELAELEPEVRRNTHQKRIGRALSDGELEEIDGVLSPARRAA